MSCLPYRRMEDILSVNPKTMYDVYLKVNAKGVSIDYVDIENGNIYSKGYRLWNSQEIGDYLYKHLVKATGLNIIRSVDIVVDGVGGI